jgi:DNA-binding CsgD family transcriptional regulator
MIKPWENLISRLGARRAKGMRYFELDESLHAMLVALAEREQRPAQEVQADLLRTALAQQQRHGELYNRWQVLSPREQEVTALACRGYTNRQIAARLGVAEETVKTHVRNALVKFNLHGKGELRMALGEWDFSEWE